MHYYCDLERESYKTISGISVTTENLKIYRAKDRERDRKGEGEIPSSGSSFD